MQNINEVDRYMEGLERDAREWTLFFVSYMRRNHPELEEVISYQMPTYKLGTGKKRNYIAFSTAKNHFSMHSMDFEYISMLKEKLSKAGKGKGCVQIKYENIAERDILTEGIEKMIKRHAELY